ncbi:protein kinase family protein [Endozoicomonas sp. OPT23]|uniref:protein kinase family protein n=1 Tax=Endozoicomonas sp. OPT23 TaxID=2072845 RepID=UPI0018914272|nr:protein kinase family protein [Endozoicomonas sp. OPT23]
MDQYRALPQDFSALPGRRKRSHFSQEDTNLSKRRSFGRTAQNSAPDSTSIFEQNEVCQNNPDHSPYKISTKKCRPVLRPLSLSSDSEARAKRRDVLPKYAQKDVLRLHNAVTKTFLIGKGLYGEVSGVIIDGKIASYVQKKNLKNEHYQGLLDEVEVGLQFTCPNLLKYIGAVTEEQSSLFSTQKSISIYMELMSGSLESQLSSKLSHQQILQYLHNIASGLLELHSSGLIHNDLKIDNILLRGDGTAVIGDLGRAKSSISCLDELSSAFPPEMFYFHPTRLESEASSSEATSIGSSPDSGYGGLTSSPEPQGLKDFKFARADIYGLGYIGLQLLTGDHFPLVWKMIGEEEHLVEGIFEQYQQQFSNKPNHLRILNELVIPCLKLELFERPSTREVLRRIDRQLEDCEHMDLG